MKKNPFIPLILGLLLLLSGCAAPASPEKSGGADLPPAPAQSNTPDVSTPPDLSAVPPETLAPQEPKDIWLYGERHGNKNILNEELRLWKEAYARGARHLFVEYGYFTAEHLNLWMKAGNDELFDMIYADWEGTASHSENVKAFYRQIKADCPETVFHGTDVGHQYATTGARYLAFLRENGQEDTEQYRLAQACVEQGEQFYSDQSASYRESMMTENFIRTLERLEGEEIMGFYGGAHIGTNAFRSEGQTVENTMAKGLLEQYGERLHLLSLDYLAPPELEPERTDTVRIGEQTYQASYFGREDISSWSGYQYREFWRLEGAYDDFRSAPAGEDMLPYSSYPTRVEEGQVYAVAYTAADGTAEWKLFRSDGELWNGMKATQRLLPAQAELSVTPGPSKKLGDIWLYGEAHGDKDYLEEELRLWKEAYARGVRHLLIEKPYYAAQFLNLWMAAEDDTILYELYNDWKMSQVHNEYVLAFYRGIKADCPETVFHGTDVQAYFVTAQRYLKYLRETGQEDSEEYRLTQEALASDQAWYNGGQDTEYRESKMTENFIQTLERLDGEEVVGFYGGAHVMTLPFSYGGQTVTDSMASRLLERYGQRVHLLDLGHVTVPILEPERMDTIQVGDKVYEAAYFGCVDISAWSELYVCREFWRLEDAYDDFKDAPRNGNVLPYSNYPTRVEEGQVYVIDYTLADGTVDRQFFRADGTVWSGMLATERFLPEG